MNNHKDTAEDNLFTFAATGKQVQWWNSVKVERFSLLLVKADKRTVSVQLHLAARESCFIVITDKDEKLLPVSWPKSSDKTEMITGPWNVRFDTKLGGPGNHTFESLQDWTKEKDSAIKYYSGTAVYKKSIWIEPSGDEILLDLGDPRFVAQVFVNGKDAGVVWCSPWQLKITPYLKKGTNDIEIHVANSLMNRMIYDAQLLPDKQVTYAYPMVASPNMPLEPSGLHKVVLIRRSRSK